MSLPPWPGSSYFERLDFPEPWRAAGARALAMIDDLDREIAQIDRELKALSADHRYIPLLQSVPGIAWGAGLHDCC